jgi:hypothetical protein
MTVFRDQVIRVSSKQLRAQYRPKDFAAMESVLLEANGVSGTVDIFREYAPTAHGRSRLWLRCPCGARCQTVGLVPATADTPAFWGCARCGRWTSRRALRGEGTA